jgi:hypothetical protein
MIGLDREEFFVFTTGGKEGGNGPGGRCRLPVRRYCKWPGTAAKGNPSALHFVFAKEQFSTPDPVLPGTSELALAGHGVDYEAIT